MLTATIRAEIFHSAELRTHVCVCWFRWWWWWGGLSFGLKAALLPDCYSQTNIWVTLALICVYLTVHFKTDSDGCLSWIYTALGMFLFHSSVLLFIIFPLPVNSPFSHVLCLRTAPPTSSSSFTLAALTCACFYC